MSVVHNLGWRPDIDGLRAIAVGIVVVFHAFPSLLPGGFVGVDVFFVISGYLITSILDREIRRGEFSLLTFYKRRARRLFPALAVLLATVATVTLFFGYPETVLSAGKIGVAGALSAANMVLLGETGYFDSPALGKPFLHLWSLGVEEQFYLAWPLVLYLLSRLRISAGASVLALLIVSLVCAELMLSMAPSHVFFLPTFRAWELAAGAVLAMKQTNFEGRASALMSAARRFSGLLCWLGILLIIGSALILSEQSRFPGLGAVPAVAGSMLVIYAGRSDRSFGSIPHRILSTRLMTLLGGMSYSLYLWHWPVLMFPASLGVSLDWQQKALLVLCSLGLAAASYRWVELPFRKPEPSRFTASHAVVALIGSALVCSVVYLLEKTDSRILALRKFAEVTDWPHWRSSRTFCPQEIVNASPMLAYCRQSKPGNAEIVLWGDSHADHLYPGLSHALATKSILLLGHMSCPAISGVNVEADQLLCRERSEIALQWILSTQSVSTVVLSSFGHYADGTDFAFEHAHGLVGPAKTKIDQIADSESKYKLLQDGLRATIERLVAAKKKVVIVIDVPELPFSPKYCYSKPRITTFNPQCEIGLHKVLERQSRMRRMIEDAVRGTQDVVIFDPIPQICDSVACRVSEDKRMVYRDSHHLSMEGSRLVGKALAAKLQQ